MNDVSDDAPENSHLPSLGNEITISPVYCVQRIFVGTGLNNTLSINDRNKKYSSQY